MHIGCEISFNESWRAPEPIDGICSVLPSTEELETVISTLARRDELRRQQLCSVPKKYELLGLRSESGLFFWQKGPKMVWFWPKWYRFLLEMFRPFCQKNLAFGPKPKKIKPFGNTALLASSKCTWNLNKRIQSNQRWVLKLIFYPILTKI